MIDLKLVQKNPELLAKALADRHSSLSVDEFLKLDGRRRALLAEVEALKQKQNAASREVAQLKREGKDAAPAYKYPHDYQDTAVAQAYLAIPATYYRPKPAGYEDTIAKRLAWLRARKAQNKDATP